MSSDTPITIDIRHEVMLKIALDLILEPLHLAYVVKDEVLKITSEQMRAGRSTPSPTTSPTSCCRFRTSAAVRTWACGGVQGRVGQHQRGGPSGNGLFSPPGRGRLEPRRHSGGGAINPAVLAQMGASGGVGSTERWAGSPRAARRPRRSRRRRLRPTSTASSN